MQGMEQEPQKKDLDSKPHLNFAFRHPLITGGVALALIAGTAYGVHEYMDDDGQSAKPPTPPEKTAGLPGQSFQATLSQTQEKKRPMPEVLANFELATLLSGDFPSGKNSGELVSISAKFCTDSSGETLPARTISRVVFRNQGGDTGPYRSAYLTSDHIKKAEDYTTEYRESVVDNAYVRPTPSAFSKKAQGQIFAQLSDNICGVKGGSPVDPQISSQKIIIGTEQLESGSPIDPSKLGWSVFGLVAVGGLFLAGMYAIDRGIIFRKKNEEPEQ